MKTQRTKDMERMIDALNLCRHLHEGQTDKCGQPYWIHPFTVGMFSFTGFAHVSQISYAIVGLLHDVPEDTGVSVEALATLIKLTDEEIEALHLLTRDKKTPYEQYIDNIIESGNEIAMVIKMNDLLHNSNLNRFVEADMLVTDKDEVRHKKYIEALKKINTKINEEAQI